MLTPREEKRQLWIDRIEAQRNSGLSITEFCKLHQLHQVSFYNWRKKLATHEPQHGNFVAVELEPATTLRLQLPGGCFLELNDHISQARLSQIFAAAIFAAKSQA